MTRRLPPKLSAHRTYQLPNSSCPYCGILLSQRSRTKDHVVGRRFVPKGSLSGCWNLHVWTSTKCNGYKADLEDDISAITLSAPGLSNEPTREPEVALEVERKTRRSTSRRTGRKVAQSAESVTLKHHTPHVSLSATFHAPPQLDERRTHELALLQLRAFFFFLTFDPDLGHGAWWRGKLVPANGAFKRDFGNEVQLAFAERTAKWDYRLILTTANGFFRVAIRKHPSSDTWSFALEWNSQFRLVGFFGDEDVCIAEAVSMPRLSGSVFPQEDGGWFAIRPEMPIDTNQDILFTLGTADEA